MTSYPESTAKGFGLRNKGAAFLLKILLFCLYFAPLYADLAIKTAWGKYTVKDPALERLFEEPSLLRLKNIDQSGMLPYFGMTPYFSRYDHSVGVFALIAQKTKAPLSEQITSLFHDVSHSAFSHAGDHLLYESNKERSYQDRIHLNFLKQTGLERAVVPYGLSLDQLDPERPEYRALERPLPELCADRIQYNVHTGLVFNKISARQARFIIKNIHFDGWQWFFTNEKAALLLADLSIHFTKNLWSSPWNFVVYEYFTDILRRAISLNIITVSDFQYGTDEQLLKALYDSKDHIILSQLETIKKDILKRFVITAFGEGQWNLKPKSRAVDPLVKTTEGLKRLSEINPSFKKNLENLREWCKEGFGVRLVEEN